jgi:hypothetical protein
MQVQVALVVSSPQQIALVYLIFKQQFSTRGHNISRIHFVRSGGQVCGTSPSRHTSASSLISTYPNFQTPPRPSIVSPYTHPYGIQRTTARAAPSGTPGPSRALGPARAHPAPSQHSSLTDCPDSDSALPQATIQLSPIGTSCQLRLPPSSSR